MGNEEMQVALKELQQTMVVMAHIEKMRREHIREQVELPIESGKLRIRIRKNLAEIREKLDRLIGPQ